MQYFERDIVPPPEVFQGREAARFREALREFFGAEDLRRAQTRVPYSTLDLAAPSLNIGLERLFHGKCSFCESRTKISPYRFRPSQEAQPMQGRDNDAHLYYAWLAEAWQNIYAICEGCRPHNPEEFPVRGSRAELPKLEELHQYVFERSGLWPIYPPKESALLLEPCVQKHYSRFWEIQLVGYLLPLNKRGEVTINHFNLNRPELVQSRQDFFEKHLIHLRQVLFEEAPQTNPWTIDSFFDFPRLEFGGTWYLVLRRFAEKFGPLTNSKPTLGQANIDFFYRRFHGKSEAAQYFDRALDELRYSKDLVKAISSRPRQGEARIDSVSLTNFKSLERLEFNMPEPLSAAKETDDTASVPSLLILGENAAGKSSILEAIALSLMSEAARYELQLNKEKLVLNPLYMGAHLRKNPGSAIINVRFKDGEDLTLTVTKGSYDLRTSVEESLPPIFAYGAFRHYLNTQRKFASSKHIRSLFRSDELLSNPESWLLSLDEPTFNAVVQVLRIIFSLDIEFDVIVREEGQCFIITEPPAPGSPGARTPLSVASSGFRAVLAMVCDILQGLMDPRVYHDFKTFRLARAIVLIDEVEAHLHPRWKMQIMRSLRQALPNVTFIATTHDPLCLRGMEDGEVLVLQRIIDRNHQSPSGLPVVVEKLVDLPNVSQLTVEQLLTSDLFQLFSTDRPELEFEMANIADLMSKQSRGESLSQTELATLQNFEAHIGEALPVGSTEVQRIAQEAMAEYLKERRQASQEQLKNLREKSKTKILEALRNI